MFIIFGTRNIEGRGRPQPLHCPHCGPDHHGRLVTVRTWFTLYFIPVIPLQAVARFVQCQSCGDTFHPEILDRELPHLAPARAEPLNPSAALREGMSIETLHRKLVEEGCDDVTARSKVDRAAGSLRHSCVRCGETYHWSIEACPACGGRLA